MLSILIPTYNYNTFPLVKELHEQAGKTGIIYEIICADDSSDNPEILLENEKINLLPHCLFFRNESNLGRSKNRNLLALKAKYKYILFLDCDTFPQNKDFIQNYIDAVILQKQLVFGGIIYESKKPEPEKMLRWVYGKKREAISLKRRISDAYGTALTSNILMKKSVFEEILFHTEITEYGYEDLVLMQEFKKIGVPVTHIDNPAFHLNLETSKDFLNKTRIALLNLKSLKESQIISGNQTKIEKLYSKIARFKLHYLMAFLFIISQRMLEKKLLSGSPSLLVFDLYKLGFFCNIKTLKK